MLYLFTGNSPFLIDEALKKWKNQFIEKYGDFNFLQIKELESFDNNALAENLFGASFLAEKKLIILDIDNSLKEEKQAFLLQNLENIPEENIVICNFPNPDKRKKFFKELKKHSTLKEFNLEGENEIYSFISKKYSGKISNSAINLIIRYKSGNTQKISSEINKLLITKDFIEEKDIIENITPELEESIFQVVDSILNLQKIEALKKIDIILNDTNIYAFYNNLIANLRTSVFIMKLKNSKNISQNDISKILDLKNRSFLVGKNYKIEYKALEKFYIGLVNIDKKMKSGKLLGSEDNDLKLEIEKEILKIQKRV